MVNSILEQQYEYNYNVFGQNIHTKAPAIVSVFPYSRPYHDYLCVIVRPGTDVPTARAIAKSSYDCMVLLRQNYFSAPFSRVFDVKVGNASGKLAECDQNSLR